MAPDRRRTDAFPTLHAPPWKKRSNQDVKVFQAWGPGTSTHFMVCRYTWEVRSSRTVLAVAALVYAYFVGGFVNNPMTNSIGDLTLALVDDRTVQVDPYAANSVDLAKRDGHHYSGMPPGLSFALVPVYLAIKPTLAILGEERVGRANEFLERSLKSKFPESLPSRNRAVLALLLVAGTFLVAIPITLLGGRAFALAARALGLASPRAIPALLAFLLLGTGVADFTSTLYHTTVAAMFLFLAFVDTAIRWDQKRTSARLALTGALLGMVAVTDYPAVVYALVVGAFAIASLPRGERGAAACGAVFAGFALPIAAMLAYHSAAFGSPFSTAYQWRDIDRNYLYRAIVDELSQGPLAFLPTWKKIVRGLFDPRCGVVFHNPALLLGVVASVAGFARSVDRRYRAFFLAVGAILLANLGYYFSLPEAIAPHIGSFGARYTVYSIPFALLALAPWVSRALERGWGTVLAVLAAFAAFPVWLYLFYGSPVKSLSEYAEFFARVGPSNYVLMKLHDAGRLSSAWPSYGGIALLGFAIWLVVRRPRKL